MVHLLPTQKACTAVDTAKLLPSNMFSFPVLPRSIVSDRDPNLPHHGCWNSVTYFRFITTSLPPFTIQLTVFGERTNKTMETALRGAAIDVLLYVQMAINGTYPPASHRSTLYMSYGFNHTTEDDTHYAHFSPARDRRDHVYDVLQRIQERLIFSVPIHDSSPTTREGARRSSPPDF